MKIYKSVVIKIFLILLIAVTSSFGNQDSKDSMDQSKSSEIHYEVIGGFATWKGFIMVRDDSIFVVKLEPQGYIDNEPESNASLDYQVILTVFILSKENTLEELFDTSLSDKEYQALESEFSFPTYDYLSKVNEEIKRELPEGSEVVSMYQDSVDSKARLIIGWVKPDGLIPEGSAVSIFEYNDKSWELISTVYQKDRDLMDISVKDINQDGQKEILYRYISPGGSGYMMYLDIIQRQQ